MVLSLQPEGNDRVLSILHREWDLCWKLQFPETITSAGGEFMSWPPVCHPKWEPLPEGGWGYSWESSADYRDRVLALNCIDRNGNPQHGQFVDGLTLRAEAIPDGDVLKLSLELKNTGRVTVCDLACDGGCWQAHNEEFAGESEVARSHVCTDGRMRSLSELCRSNPVRCEYHVDADRYNPAHEWFWGRSRAKIDQPAMVGMVSRDEKKALVLAYEGADSALANADEHHCLHSRPFFGSLEPGERKLRRGWIVFGKDLEQLTHECQGFLKESIT